MKARTSGWRVSLVGPIRLYIEWATSRYQYLVHSTSCNGFRHVLIPLLVVAGGVVVLYVFGINGGRRLDALPPDTSVPQIRFTDVTASAGIRFRHVSGAAGKKLLPETMGGGVAVLDFDRDGRPDLFFVNGRNWPGHPTPKALAPHRLSIATAAIANLKMSPHPPGWRSSYMAWAWRRQISITTAGPIYSFPPVGGDRLLRNVPGGSGRRFGEHIRYRGRRRKEFARCVGRGLPELVGTDFVPRLGDLARLRRRCKPRPVRLPLSELVAGADIGIRAVLPGGVRPYVPPNQFGGVQCSLYRNRGNGTFEDVSATAGVHVTEPFGPVAKALGVVACDPDGDGWPDLVVANDTVRNFFFTTFQLRAAGDDLMKSACSRRRLRRRRDHVAKWASTLSKYCLVCRRS